MDKAYNTYTYNDPNFIKRWLHQSRFRDTLKLLNLKKEEMFLDYGCGDGYFLDLVSNIFQKNKIYGFEPYKNMYKQAEKKLINKNVELHKSPKFFENKNFDKITCLETCEHLNHKDLDKIFKNFNLLLKDNGKLLISVPIEIGLPSLFKNLYRFVKKEKDEGLNFKNSIKSVFGLKINRKSTEIEPNLNYYFSHIGFNHQKFESELKKYFSIEKKKYKPFPILKSFLNNTIYYVCKKR